MDSSAMMMLHEARYEISGKLREHQDYLNASVKEWESLCNFYAERTGRTSAYWQDRLERRDLWFTAQECLEEGLIDEIVESPFKQSA
jgi:ATP-dependent protease ClpP protease subunit